MTRRTTAGVLAGVAACLVAMPVLAEVDPRATAAVAKFLAAYHATSSFTARMEVLTCQGAQSSHMTVDMVYARPRNVALTVVTAPQFPAARGTTLTWLGDRRARVSTRFYGLPLAVTLPVDDPRICNLRGYSIAQVDLGTEVPMLSDPGTHLRYLGTGSAQGRAAEGIEVRSRRLLHGIEREVIWLDLHTHFPLVREMYETGRVVYRMAFSAYSFNPRVPANLFASF